MRAGALTEKTWYRVRTHTRWGVQATFWVTYKKLDTDPNQGWWEITNVVKVRRGPQTFVPRQQWPPQLREQVGKLFETREAAFAYVEGLRWDEV